jgi:hypothetical protein
MNGGMLLRCVPPVIAVAGKQVQGLARVEGSPLSPLSPRLRRRLSCQRNVAPQPRTASVLPARAGP